MAVRITIMIELSGPALLRLMAALSPAFPVGSFSFSHGLERAVHDGLVTDRDSLEAWLRDLLEHGSAWNDAVLLAAAWTAEGEITLAGIGELGIALAGSRERLMETSLQGAAFTKSAATWDDAGEATDLPHAAAVGAFARRQGIPLESAVAAWLQAFASNLIQAALRLAPIGQTAGLHTLSNLEPVILDTASRAARSSLDGLGSATFLSEVSAMRHETQYSRIFRS